MSEWTRLEQLEREVSGRGPTNWMTVGEDESQNSLTLIASGSKGLSELRGALKGVTQTRSTLSYASVDGKVLLFRYGKHSKELSKSRDSKLLFRNQILSIDVKNLEQDLSDQKIKEQSELPSLPKLGGDSATSAGPTSAAPLTNSDSNSSLLSPEEIEAEIAAAKQHEEEIARSQKLKEDSLRRYSDFASKVNEENAKLKLKQSSERAEIDRRKQELAKRLDTPVKQWMSYQAPNATTWHRRWVVLQRGQLTIFQEENEDSRHSARHQLKNIQVNNAEEDTGMRGSFSVTSNEGTYYFCPDNHEQEIEARAAFEAFLQ
ncbi:hypothetical protein HDU76_010251 [Blyttiomyces sp. JEL0837]|nr:hypothetical protein HDU76_010251 [Blyttiomyces sp. JEL0837]